MSATAIRSIPVNAHVAAKLEDVAALLEEQNGNPFRVQAYRNAAATLRAGPEPVDEILDREGVQGLDRLPGIGHTLARLIDQLVTTGRLPMLDRLRGESNPVGVLGTVPGIGPTLARRLHDEYDITTLEQLEEVAHDGTLERIPGFGPKRVAGIRDALSTRLSRRGRRAPSIGAPAPGSAEPDVAELLDVDLEYRDRAAAGSLPMIAPRRFNPDRRAWLPVFHTDRHGRHYTALFSNTARAHQLGKTHNWVVLYFDGRGGERQHTIVTVASGPLRGRRIVRGREGECAAYYARLANDRTANT